MLFFLAPFISKIGTTHIFNFLSVKYFGKGWFLLKIWHIRVNYCWSYGLSNLLAMISWLIEYSSYEKAVFMITGSSNMHSLKFWHFSFSNFQTISVKIVTKKSPGFNIDFGSTDKVLPLHQYLWSEISRQLTALWIFFLNLHGRAYCFLTFVKWGKY